MGKKKSKKMLLTKKLIILVSKSGYLSLNEMVLMTTRLCRTLSFGEHAALGCIAICSASPLCTRFSMWKRMLLTPNVSKDLVSLSPIV
jgi:hypothetical protein